MTRLREGLIVKLKRVYGPQIRGRAFYFASKFPNIKKDLRCDLCASPCDGTLPEPLKQNNKTVCRDCFEVLLDQRRHLITNPLRASGPRHHLLEHATAA